MYILINCQMIQIDMAQWSLIYFQLSIASPEMGADQSASNQSQTTVKNTSYSTKQNQNNTQSSCQPSSHYQRKSKIFTKEDRPKPVLSQTPSQSKDLHLQGKFGQITKKNQQRNPKIYYSDKQIAPSSAIDFKQQQDKLTEQRIKLRKQITRDLQSYQFTYVPPSHPRSKAHNINKKQQQQQLVAQTSKQITAITQNAQISNYTIPNYISSPDLLKIDKPIISQINPQDGLPQIKGRLRSSVDQKQEILRENKQTSSSYTMSDLKQDQLSRISEQDYQLVINYVEREQKRQFTNPAQKSNHLMLEVKQRTQSAVISQNGQEMHHINGSLISVSQTQNGRGMKMYVVKQNLTSIVQAEPKSGIGLYRIGDRLVSNVQD